MDQPVQDSYKKWGIVLIVFLLILIPSEIALTRPNAFANFQLMLKLASQEKPKVATLNKSIEEVRQESHPSLFYLDLLYDPNSKTASKIDSGEFHGDVKALSDQPSKDPLSFNYKTEVLSYKGDVIVSGWRSPFKEVISNDQGKYKIRATIESKGGETLNIYTEDGQKIWEEKIK